MLAGLVTFGLWLSNAVRRGWVIVLLALAGCDNMVEPIDPVRLQPGPVQVAAVAKIAACTGRALTVEELDWWLAEGFADHPGEEIPGAFNLPNDVYLTDPNISVYSQHEVLHYVLRGDHKHKSRLWVECGLW